MKFNAGLIVFLSTWVLFAPSAASAQAADPALKILSFKISKDYSAVLDRKPSLMSADNGELPMTEAEISARSNVSSTNTTTTPRRNTTANASVINDEKRARGRLRSTVKILDKAEWVELTIRNTSTKPIKSIVWDFAFPRFESGKLLLRYEAINPIEVKPGGKKSLKQPLPDGASRCKVVNVATMPDEKTSSFEFICGRGINDPTQVPEKQEPIIIKRIEYADGSVWEK